MSTSGSIPVSAIGRCCAGVGWVLLLAAVHGSAVYYPCFDANGNITQYVNSSSGTTVARYDYDAFGREFHSSGTMADEFVFRFSTKYTDNETGLVYYGYRFYNPELGRWINRDPIGKRGGVNLYGFVGNGAINRGDVLGMYTMPEQAEWEMDRIPCQDLVEAPYRGRPYTAFSAPWQPLFNHILWHTFSYFHNDSVVTHFSGGEGLLNALWGNNHINPSINRVKSAAATRNIPITGEINKISHSYKNTSPMH